jgi:lysine biosynthesis protein LysW
MIALCPECECRIPLRMDEHPAGTTVFCPECETELEVSSLHPPILSYVLTARRRANPLPPDAPLTSEPRT